jgi:SAM-dependent methyltransferase
VTGTDGYVSDIGYTAGFYPETAPGRIAFAALAAGREAGAGAAPARVLELGFGQGFGLALLAAANPDVAFEGCDFNASHVAHARGLAEAAGLTNLALVEGRFEDLAARAGAADVDAAILHGVLSWVSPQTQAALVAILRQRLRPGGSLFVSYNCAPGWAPLAPIRQFVHDVARAGEGGSERRVAHALDLLARVKAADAPYFRANPAAARHVEAMLAMEPAYLAHEYLAEHWRALTIGEAAAILAGAGLSFVASANLPENFDAFAAPAALGPLIAGTADPILRETLRDFAGGRQFRRDVFARGTAPAQPAMDADSPMRFLLAAPPQRVGFRFEGPLGELIGRDDFYRPLVDRLAQGEASLAQLRALPAFGGAGAASLVECLALLVHSGQVLARAAPAPQDGAPARRFNRVVVEAARAGGLYGWLAAPAARTGIRVDDFGLLTLGALLDGAAGGAEDAARHGLAVVKALGRRPSDGTRRLDDDGEALAFLAARMARILEQDVPVWRRLGIL